MWVAGVCAATHGTVLVPTMDALQQQLVFIAGSVLCAGIGSVHDVRERRIPNRVTGPAMVAGLVLHTVLGGWHGLGDSALAGLIAGGIFLVFFLAGGMGAGDVKLMAAVGCIAGTAHLSLDELNLGNGRTLRLPFALPIAAGCLITLCSVAWEARP
jgi:prepilin signal peptidase PulO-like enzyme (type II secretory pathway)